MDISNNQTSGGDMDTFAEELKRVCQSGALSPEEFKRRKADLDFKIMKRRAAGRDKRMADLKERVRRRMKGETGDE